MQDTRQQILEILKRQGKVTVQELSTELGLTSVTVRHHLEILRSEGYITDPEVQHSNRPGRPRYIYRLTAMAADLFPSNYAGLADALLEALQHLSPERKVEILKEAARQLATNAGSMPQEPNQRRERMSRFLKRLGFVFRWEKDEKDGYYLHICNCPYYHVAQAHPETCEIDESMLRILAGTDIQRVEGHASEDSLCSYKIHWSLD
ncbi:MAG: helix-turn-helix transcriptional regulator [Anaerolineae bacterium]